MELGLRKEIDFQEAFGFGTVETFFQTRYQTSSYDYRRVLDTLKEEYGDWIEVEFEVDW